MDKLMIGIDVRDYVRVIHVNFQVNCELLDYIEAQV